jgi:hypothetical protein
MPQAKDPMARAVHVHFPSGDRQYWLTEQEFSVGASIRHNGNEWIVVEIRPTPDGALDLTVREHADAGDARERTGRVTRGRASRSGG